MYVAWTTEAENFLPFSWGGQASLREIKDSWEVPHAVGRHVFDLQNRETVLQDSPVMLHVLGTGRSCFLGLWRGSRSFLPYCCHFGEHEAMASSWVVASSACFISIQVKQK